MKPSKHAARGAFQQLSEATPNPSLEEGDPSGWGGLHNQSNGNGNGNGNGHGRAVKQLSRRYFATVDDTGDWPADLQLYNQRFAQTDRKSVV